MSLRIRYGRDSFDRFGDDLCELLLKYLSLSDSFRVECVSKQFARLGFNAHKKLSVGVNGFDFYVNGESIANLYYYYVCQVINPWFECVLKKCALIEVIDISIDINDEMIDIFCKSCANLKRIKICHNKIEVSAEMWRTFAMKCGQSLESIDMIDAKQSLLRELLSSAPNLKSLASGCDVSLYLPKNTDNYLPNLSEVGPRLCVGINDTRFDLFADHYCARLKKLDIMWAAIPENSRNYFALMARFVKLEALVLLTSIQCDQNTISDGLRLLADNCVCLQELVIIDYTASIYVLNAAFPQLKRLTFVSYAGDLIFTNSCDHLTHLTINTDNFDDSCLNHIYKRVPHLISFELKTRSPISDSSLHSLAKLSRLKKLKLKIVANFVSEITDAGVCDVISSCEQIREITILAKINITTASLYAFIERAKQYPKVQHKFWCALSFKDLTNADDFPHNLLVRGKKHH